jgi:hypothetical protein
MMAATGAVLLVQGLGAMAPVTGSDALHYHFTTPMLILQNGFHPNFFVSHSFFSGQSHLLILAGLTLGSEQLGMGLLFLGGVLAAASAACLARRWVGRQRSWLVAFLFLVTPLVFWQISAAGAPDLWMAFFVTIGVVAISRAREMPRMAHAIVVGALAGGAAGTKYTGCIMAGSMGVAYLWEARSAVKALFFAVAMLASGIWPYARNFVWSGDPFFPFLLRRISPDRVNAYTLASYLADTGASEHKSFWQLAAFPLFASIDPAHLGFWQFLGPLVLAFAPLLILVIRNTASWRVTLTVWALSTFLIGWSSGMTRFLAPILPIALAAVIAGTVQLKPRGWNKVSGVAKVSVCGFIFLSLGGLIVYEFPALLVATGLTSRQDYLRESAPDYGQTEFVNRVLEKKENPGTVLVFMRHLYYLHVPFLYADPSASWAIDPSVYRNPEEWRRLLRHNGVRWIVRSADYPPSIARPLQTLEAQGALVPVARSDVQEFRGMRISGERTVVPVTIFCFIPER